MSHDHSLKAITALQPWTKGRLVGQKRPLKPKDVWAIRIRLELSDNKRELALFDLAIDSKLRACDLVCLKIRDLRIGGRTRERATVVQKKTGRPVQFEIAASTRRALDDWIQKMGDVPDNYLFPSRMRGHPHMSTRQYARLVHR